MGGSVLTAPGVNRKPSGPGLIPVEAGGKQTMKSAIAAACLAVSLGAALMFSLPEARADLIEPPSQGMTTTRLAPPDVPLEPTLAEAIDKLKAIIAARDVKGLTEMLSPGVTSSFGDDGGPENFLSNYGLNGPDAANSQVWTEMERLLSIGVAEMPGTGMAAAPWPYAIWPDDLDPFIHMVVIAQGASLMSAPSSTAPAIHPLDYDILTLLYDEENPDPAVTEIVDGKEISWLKVADPKGVEGYVRDDWTVSTIGYRLGFERSESGWLIVFLVAGD